jgi:hypothetical protein
VVSAILQNLCVEGDRCLAALIQLQFPHCPPTNPSKWQWRLFSHNSQWNAAVSEYQ